jgi:cyanamide hydratase
MSTEKELHGWRAVPRDPAVLLKDKSSAEPKPLTVDEIALPESPLAKEVLAYAKRELNEQTFNHSMRVYYYGENHTSEAHRATGRQPLSFTPFQLFTQPLQQ